MKILWNELLYPIGIALVLFVALVLASNLASAGTPTAPPPQGAVLAPLGTFGVKFCNQIVLWVILQDGKVVRMDKDHHPKTPEEMQAFLRWVETGPTDIEILPCPVSA